MDPVKKAFEKVKQDVDSLKQDLFSLKENLIETREQMIDICGILRKLHKKLDSKVSTHSSLNQTVSTHVSTDDIYFKPLKHQNWGISTGNQGVSTDRQTNRQTDRQTQNTQEIQKNPVDNAAEILASLDNIKKELRLKFKRLTDQEMLIFSTIYQLEEEKGYTDYKNLSERLKLTESSIRDYVQRLIKKGIPVEKTKINNKNIQLKISGNLKKIASLSTIMQLRGI